MNEERTTGWKEKDDYTIKGIREMLENKGLNAFIPWKPAHLAYLTNYYDSIHQNLPWEETSGLLVIPLEKKPFIVKGNHFIGNKAIGSQPWWLTEYHRGGKTYPETVQAWASLMKDKGLAEGRIGIETKCIPAALLDVMKDLLPQAEFVPSDDIIPQLKLCKTSRELTLMKTAHEIAVSAMETFMNVLRRGGTRREAELERAKKALEYRLYGQSGFWPAGACNIQGSGGVADVVEWWDPEVKERWRKRFDMPVEKMIVEYGRRAYWQSHVEAYYQGYIADISFHEFFFGKPHPDEEIVLAGPWMLPGGITYKEAEEEFHNLRKVQSGVLNSIKIGMTAKQAYEAVNATINENDLYREVMAKTGWYIHGVGLECHEEPIFASWGRCTIPFDGPPVFKINAVVNSEFHGRHWTCEEPFILTEGGWTNLVPLRDLHGNTT